jgi:hypothetical protein
LRALVNQLLHLARDIDRVSDRFHK